MVTEAGRVRAEGDLAAALASARLGDEDGFRVLFRAIQPPLLRYLYVLVGSDAEDVASDTWLRSCRWSRRRRSNLAVLRPEKV